MSKVIRFSSSYSRCAHNYLITGLPEQKKRVGMLQESFSAVLLNILQRSAEPLPSEYLEQKLGKLKDDDKKWLIIDPEYVPSWHKTIKGNDRGFNPADKFFYDIWEEQLPEYAWVRQLVLPEAELDKIMDDFSGAWREQCVDFYLPQASLVIEIDGSQHNALNQKRNDSARDEAVKKAKNITVIRIPASAINANSPELRTYFEKLKKIFQKTDILSYETEVSDYVLNQVNYEIVIRFQMLILTMLNRGILTDSGEWKLDIPQDMRKLFEIAAEDIFIWLYHLYGLKGLSYTRPDIIYEESGIPIKMFIYRRPDELKYNGVCVLTDYWDNVDYFRISSAELINYDVEWPISFDSPKINHLRFLLRNIFYDGQGGTRFTDFKEGQLPIIINLLNLKKTIGILPTGGGKSLCYQIAAMLQPAITFSVCPIMSLQLDQKRNADLLGITRGNHISGLIKSSSERHRIGTDFGNGKYQMLWISPERFQTVEFRKQLSDINHKFNIAYAVIDEVHCLSEWGHDFRTSYLTLLPTISKYCPQAILVGLTATASMAVLKDLKIEFDADNTSVRATPTLRRNNLTMSVRNTKEKKKMLSKILKEEYSSNRDKEKKQGIIFTLVKDRTDDPDKKKPSLTLLDDVRKELPDVAADKFHGEMVSESKEDVQTRFMDGKINVLSATKAFGVGLNKRDVRYTIHYGMPWSVESFYQEAGRAGRDGKPSNCYIIYADPYRRSNEGTGQEKIQNKGVIDHLFMPSTTTEEIENIQKNSLKDTDLGTIFFLWGRNNQGIDTDLNNIKHVISFFKNSNKAIDPDGELYYPIDADSKPPAKGETSNNILSADAELALYRLSLLGVVRDWTIIFHPSRQNHIFVYLCDDITEQKVKEAFFKYIRRYSPDFGRIPRDEDKKYLDAIESEEPYYYRYARILIEWSYDHIIFNRRQAIYNIQRYCDEYTSPSEFRDRIDAFLAISEQSVWLDQITSGNGVWQDWFRALYDDNTDDVGNPDYHLLTAEGFGNLRESAARYRESYRDVTGLNLIYVISGAISGRFDMLVDTNLFDSVLKDIKRYYSTDSKRIIESVLGVMAEKKEYFSEEILRTLSKSLLKDYPEMAWTINEKLEDDYSTSFILNSLTKEIISIVGGAKWQMKH